MNRHKKQIVSKRQTAARPTSGSLGESKKTLVDLAQAYHQQGELSRAIATYELAIRRQPGRAEVLQGLGTAMFQSGRVSDAVKALEHSLKLNPHEATTWNTLGAAYRSLARHTEAQAAYSEAIRLNPKYLEPWLNLGRVLWSTKRYEQALATLRALPEPTVESWRMQAEILTACGDLSEAKTILDRLTLNNAPSVELSIAHGNLLAKLGHLEKAEAAFLTALRLDKGCVAALVNLGNLHQSQGRWGDAVRRYEQASCLDPRMAEIPFCAANAFEAMDRWEEAIALLQKALVLRPTYVAARYNLGRLLHRMNRWNEAFECYNTVLAHDQQHLNARANRAVLAHEFGAFTQAQADYETVLASDPNHVEARWNASLTYLLLGQLAKGWDGFETRWDNKALGLSRFAGLAALLEPGTAIRDKRILLVAEQGYGDSLQFIQYAFKLKALGATVLAVAPKALINLFKNIPAIDAVYDNLSGHEPPADYFCPMMSLPRVLGFTCPDDIYCFPNYLRPSTTVSEIWSKQLPPSNVDRIGVAWSSMSAYANDHKRSMALSDFLQAFNGIEAALFCLSPTLNPKDQETLKHTAIHFQGERLSDFEQTAALIEQLDLVITTCTSVAHLAAGMGRETWILLSHVPDWRWFLAGDKSPWYPSVTLFRQITAGDWTHPIKAINDALNQRGHTLQAMRHTVPLTR